MAFPRFGGAYLHDLLIVSDSSDEDVVKRFPPKATPHPYPMVSLSSEPVPHPSLMVVLKVGPRLAKFVPTLNVTNLGPKLAEHSLEKATTMIKAGLDEWILASKMTASESKQLSIKLQIHDTRIAKLEKAEERRTKKLAARQESQKKAEDALKLKKLEFLEEWRERLDSCNEQQSLDDQATPMHEAILASFKEDGVRKAMEARLGHHTERRKTELHRAAQLNDIMAWIGAVPRGTIGGT